LILTDDEMFAQIVERYMKSWQMGSRRAVSRADLLTTVQSSGAVSWVAIVDVDNVGAAELSDAIEIVRAILPTRVITIGGGGPLRKPVRQSHLYDAIFKASRPDPYPGNVDAQAAPRTASRVRKPASTAPTGREGEVLVAEDNAQLQELLKLQFDELGVPVTFVSDGLQVLEALRTGTYSMVFMDCHMPNMDGLSATRAIRSEEATTGCHVWITAMTANAFAEDRAECFGAGMDDYLAKPIRLAKLRAAIERVNEGRALSS
jgi:CheY-like chemotaxis protein